MKSSKTFLKISFSICVALAVAFYFAGCSSSSKSDGIVFGTGTGTGTDPGTGTGTGTGPGTGTGTTTITGPSITQFGITWTFDQDVTIGQFANGDYWVVGPVTIIGIDPPSTEIGGRTRDGSMVNPSPAEGINARGITMQGYDSSYRLWDTYHQPYYDADLNTGRPNGQDLTPGNPLVLQPHSSLISSISRDEADATPQLRTAAILTVLDSPAPDGSFRPPYTGADKTIRFNKNNLNYSLLANLTPVGSTPRLEQQAGDPEVMYDAGNGLTGYDITDSSVERQFERPWIDHMMLGVAFARQLHPYENMPDYRREIADVVGTAAAMLHLDFTNEEKETLLVRFVQVGIDYYAIVQEGRNRYSQTTSASIMGGRKWPVLFAGLVLDDADMKGIGAFTGDYYGDMALMNPPSDYVAFGEDFNTFYVSQDVVDHGTSSPNVAYTAGDIGLPEWVHIPWYRDFDKRWVEADHRITACSCWAGFILAAHIMGAKELWNHDVLFDYYDRYMDVELQLHGATSWMRQWSRFPGEMWDTYRADYRPVWVRNNPTDIFSIGHLEW